MTEAKAPAERATPTELYAKHSNKVRKQRATLRVILHWSDKTKAYGRARIGFVGAHGAKILRLKGCKSSCGFRH